MNPVDLELTSRRDDTEPTGVVILEDIEDATEGAVAACNDDNPYR